MNSPNTIPCFKVDICASVIDVKYIPTITILCECPNLMSFVCLEECIKSKGEHVNH
jgi:hypothetical protein